MRYHIIRHSIIGKVVALIAAALLFFDGISFALAPASRSSSSGFREEAASQIILQTIGRYLKVGISPHTLIPAIKSAIPREMLDAIKSHGTLLYGCAFDEITYNEAEKVYYLPIYRNLKRAFRYKFYLAAAPVEDTDNLIHSGKDGVNVYMATETLASLGPVLLDVISDSVERVMRRGQEFIVDAEALRSSLEGALSDWSGRYHAKAKVDYDQIAQIGYVLYVPVTMDGTDLYARYFYPENAPEDDANILCATAVDSLQAELLTKRSFMHATLSRSKYKDMFRERTIPYLLTASKNKHVYIISGDIDFLKKINTIYGECIVNAILAEIHLAIRHRLDDIEREYKLTERIRLVFGGDEFIISFPPSALDSDTITSLLNDLRETVKAVTRRKFGVAALAGFNDRLASLTPDSQQALIRQIEEVAVTFDFKSRRKGNLFLFSLAHPDDLDKSLAEFTGNINTVLAHFGLRPVESSYEWLADGSRFRDGYMWMPTISAGIVDAEEVTGEIWPDRHLQELTEEEARAVFVESLHRAEDALQVAKRARDAIAYGLYPKHIHAPSNIDQSIFTGRNVPTVISDSPIRPDERDNHDLRLMTDGAFRAHIYDSIKKGEKARLIQIDPVYKGRRLDALVERMTLGEREALRGTGKGVGLRAVNDLMGHEVGDLVIQLVCDSIISNLPRGWHVDTSPPDDSPVLLSRFVDRVRIYAPETDGRLPTDEEISGVIANAKAAFNAAMNGIEIAALTAVVVETDQFAIPGMAFEKLETLSALKERAGDAVVTGYSPVHEPLIQEHVETAAFEKAGELNEYVRTAGERRVRLEAVERNVDNYLKLNFGSPEFAAEWDNIHVGPSNNMFYELSKDALDPEAPSVLDLGTGTGKGLLPVAQRYERGLVVGVDKSSEMLDYAREKFAREFPMLARKFLVANAENMRDEIPSEFTNFDAAYARFLSNFIDLEVVLPQVLERLKPGGITVFNVFAGHFWGHTDEFTRSNPFEEARIRVARDVLEERVIPILRRDQREKLIADGQIRTRPDGSWEILPDPITQKEGLDSASLERALRHAGFEEIKIEPVSEMYPVEEKQRSFLLTKSIPYFWPITNLIEDNAELRIRLVQEICDRMPFEFKTGEHRFTDIFVSARKPGPTFIASTARMLLTSPGDISPERLKLFFDLLTANSATFVDFYSRGLIGFEETPHDGAYLGHGREVNMPLTRKNMFAFLEPILTYIIREKPDEILLIDYGARPFEKPIRHFLKEFGLDIPIRFIHASAQTAGHDLVDVYRMLKPDAANFRDRHVMVIDDNAVHLKTGPLIDRALRAAGAKRVSYTVACAFNRDASNFVDLATVKLPGDDMWISPERGFLSWTEWEGNPELADIRPEDNTPEAAARAKTFEDEAMRNFAAELQTYRAELADRPIPVNATPRRETVTQDEIAILEFITDEGMSEEEFISASRGGSVHFTDSNISKVIDTYTNGAFREKLGLGTFSLDVRRASNDGSSRLTFSPGLDLRSVLRYYLSLGPASAELFVNPEVELFAITEDGKTRGSVRVERLYDNEGLSHLLLDRIDPDSDVGASIEDMVEKAVEALEKLAKQNGYEDVLVPGRDITFSKLGPVRDIFNERFRNLEAYEGILTLLNPGGAIPASLEEHQDRTAPLKALRPLVRMSASGMRSSERAQVDKLIDTLKLIKSRETNRQMIVALGTSWIEGYAPDKAHYKALNRLITSLRNFAVSQGICFIDAPDESLLSRVMEARENRNGAKVIILAGEKTLRSEFGAFLGDANVLLAAIDKDSALDDDCYMRIIEMLNISIRLAFNMQVDMANPDITIRRDKNFRNFFIFLPKTERFNKQEDLDSLYAVQAFA